MSINTNTTLADIIGAIAVALASGVVAAALYHMQAVNHPWVVWVIALPFLITGSLYLWHLSKVTRDWDSDKWVNAMIFTPLFGAISFAIDVLIGSTNGQYKTFVDAASHAGSPFGFLLTVLICPAGTLVALGSWIRCLMLRALRTQP